MSQWAAALVACASLIGFAGSAQALAYVGRFDPLYGAPFDGLFWSGEVVITIPDACVISGTGVVMTGGACDSAAYSAKVFLNDTSSAFGGTDTLMFTDTVSVSKARFEGGLLTGVESDFFAKVRSSLYSSAFDFQLLFTFDGARLFHSDINSDAHSNQTGQGHSEHGRGLGLGHIGGCPTATRQMLLDPGLNDEECGYSATFASVTYRLIPEPGSLALVLGALAATGIVMRRRKSI